MGQIYLISERQAWTARHHVMAENRLGICETLAMMRCLYKNYFSYQLRKTAFSRPHHQKVGPFPTAVVPSGRRQRNPAIVRFIQAYRCFIGVPQFAADMP